MKKWIWSRFKANLEDSRPVKWPPPGAFWESGFNDSHAIVCAYLKTEDQLKEFWPEAEDPDFMEVDCVTFTDRFRKPSYWDETTETCK